MKLSLAWIFDHIIGDWKECDVNQLVSKFNATTAEIEKVESLFFDSSLFFIGKLQSVKASEVILFCPELDHEITLPSRVDAQPGSCYVVLKDKKDYIWALMRHLGSEKDGLLPAIEIREQDLAGKWRLAFEQEDYILHLDNKSITNRPDLWGHRGFAREIAALLGLPMRAEDHFLANKPVRHYETTALAAINQPIQLTIATPACRRLAGYYIDEIKPTASFLWMAHRLCRVDARPINALVDMTNYVMCDLGQPMHAFDAQTIESRELIATMAKEGQVIELLDGEEVKLTAQDCIISDGKHPLALAGIMGGKNSAVSPKTHSILIEAANFDASTIRKTSARLKKRTEASARFEKSLDPMQNTQGLLRFLKLLEVTSMHYKGSDAIVSVGPLAQERKIVVTHDEIVRRLGVAVSAEVVERLLTSIGFGVQHQKNGYVVMVPSYRATKDITIKEDIIEEIGRLLGYTTFPQHLPSRAMKPFALTHLQRIRLIKNLSAYSLGMHEVYNYALYDEEFLQRLKWSSLDGVALKNPLSAHWQTLVTSLIPHVLKNVYQNHVAHDALRFFEINRMWSLRDGKVHEQQSYAAIFYAKKAFDFYEGKAYIQALLRALGLLVVWQKSSTKLAPWYSAYQSAELVCGGTVIGHAGMVSPEFLSRLVEGHAFIVELSVDFLKKQPPLHRAFEPLPKYQSVTLDISMMAPLVISVAQIEEAIIKADARIRDVQLVDYFSKDEWHDQRSMTIRMLIVDEDKTMTKQEIDDVWDSVTQAVSQAGVTIR